MSMRGDRGLLSVITIIAAVMLAGSVLAGPFAPPAEQTGSTAIHMDDERFVGWATGVAYEPGWIDISNPSGGKIPFTPFGDPSLALDKAVGDPFDVVSLGDGGYATLTFAKPICDGPGYDLAVFENSFSDTMLELAFVEVSSDGMTFFRFDSVSLTPTDVQVSGFDPLDATNLHNLAGKYRGGYGTPFDLNELAGRSPLLNVMSITHVRVRDVVGCIQNAYTTYDSQGYKVNEPWSTPFTSGGFDLDAVGVLNFKNGYSVSGRVQLRDFDPAKVSGFPIEVELRKQDGSTVTRTATLDADGDYTILADEGTYNIAFKASHWLKKLYSSPVVVNQDVAGINVSLTNGDCNGDNGVDEIDYALLSNAWYQAEGDPAYNAQADLNADGGVDEIDYAVLSNAWYTAGD